MPRHFHLLAIVCALLAGMEACAQEVEVANVRFTTLRAPWGGTSNWLEADVQVHARPASSSPGQMVSRVRVALLVGYELPAPVGGERQLDHYRAEAECVALETGRTSVRFYLPPEVVKRDRLRAEPKYWSVELSVAGRAVPPSHAATAPTLTSPEARRNFQTRAGADAAKNDGILLPQYLTPFASEYPRATPSFVRREVR